MTANATGPPLYGFTLSGDGLVSITYDPATDSCPAAKPKGPTVVTATPGPLAKQITVGWNEANPNGSPILSYTATCKGTVNNPGVPTKTTTVGPARRSTVIGALVAEAVLLHGARDERQRQRPRGGELAAHRGGEVVGARKGDRHSRRACGLPRSVTYAGHQP